MKTTFPKLLFLAMLCVPLCVFAPQPAPPLDFTPQEPPKAAALIARGNPTNVLAAAISSLTTNGFSVIKSDRREFVLEVRKKKTATAKEYDKVVVWLARDAAKPDLLKAYVLFGRYLEVFGTGGKFGRRHLDEDEEESLAASWKPQLIEAMESTGE